MDAGLDLSIAALAVVLASAMVGGVVQGVLGFGGAYIAVPVLAVVAPGAVPVAMLLGLAPYIAWLAWRERGGIDRQAFVTISVARVPGIALGTWVVVVASTRVITLIVATILLLGVAATVGGWRLEPTRWTQRAVGAVSGFTATTASIGGPPMALLYHRADADDRRGTLSAIFIVGIVVTLVMLGGAGQIRGEHLPIAGLVVLGLFGGGVAAPVLNRRLDDGWLRHAVLVWAAVGAVVAAARAVIG